MMSPSDAHGSALGLTLALALAPPESVLAPPPVPASAGPADRCTATKAIPATITRTAATAATQSRTLERTTALAPSADRQPNWRPHHCWACRTRADDMTHGGNSGPAYPPQAVGPAPKGAGPTDVAKSDLRDGNLNGSNDLDALVLRVGEVLHHVDGR